MKPFYQGKIDTFCAIYAVLNALRITHGIRTLRARELFNDCLLKLSKNQQEFEDVLNQTTDYIALVDELLKTYAKAFPFIVESPFTTKKIPSVEEFWQVCEKWVNCDQHRTGIFRFKRFFDNNPNPTVKHWTVIGSIDATTLTLYDSSHDAEAIRHLHQDMYVTNIDMIDKDKSLYVQPETLRLIRLPF
ncbi:MAG: hypothetical protein IJU79_01200 [Desulfovibrionaceae bacterium]|nr:hypothetical protein [Desulfovibrionaceae bacterium]